VALHLLRQISVPDLQARFCVHFINASLDLAVATFFARGDKRVRVRQLRGTLWQVRGLRYLFLPAACDSALPECKELLAGGAPAFVIVPVAQGDLFHHALLDYWAQAPVNVMSFDRFVTWRTTFAGLDAQWSYDRVWGHLINRYNHHTTVARLAQSMLMRVPAPGPDSCTC
jgi:hypothetical protein